MHGRIGRNPCPPTGSIDGNYPLPPNSNASTTAPSGSSMPHRSRSAMPYHARQHTWQGESRLRQSNPHPGVGGVDMSAVARSSWSPLSPQAYGSSLRASMRSFLCPAEPKRGQCGEKGELLLSLAPKRVRCRRQAAPGSGEIFGSTTPPNNARLDRTGLCFGQELVEAPAITVWSPGADHPARTTPDPTLSTAVNGLHLHLAA